MPGMVAAVEAGFGAVELFVAIESEMVAVLGMVRAGAGCDVAAVEVTVGVVRGGAIPVEAVLTTDSVLVATGSCTRVLSV